MSKLHLIYAVSGCNDLQKLNNRIIDICKIIAKDNIILKYYLNHLSPFSNNETYIKSLNTLLNKLSPNEYQTLLLLCQKSDLIDYESNNEESNLNQRVKDLIGLQISTQDTSSIGDSSGDAVSTLSSSINPHREDSQLPSTSNEITTSLSGSIGIFQVMYDAFSNNILMQNAFDSYVKSLHSLKVSEIEKVLANSNNPQEQITELKKAASNELCRKLFGTTLYSGFVYSVTFGMLASAFIPYVYAYVVAGIAISAVVARNNSKIMSTNIQEFINNPEVDVEAVRVINDLQHMRHEMVESYFQENLITLNRLAPYGMRFTSLISAIFLPYVPLISGIGGTVNSLFTWRNTRTYLQKLYDNPISALQNALYVDDHTPFLLKYKGSNLIRTYIFNTLGMDNLKTYLKEADVPIPPESNYSGLRNILSKLNILESSKTKSLLDALYNNSNRNSLHLLENVRTEAKHHELYNSLNEYLITHNKQLDIIEPDLSKLITQHNNNNSADFLKLMSHYLNDKVKSDVNFGMWITGLTVGVTWSLLLMAAGSLIFTGLTPQFAAASVLLFTTIMVGTYIAKNSALNNVTKALDTIDPETFKRFLADNKMQHVLMLQNKQTFEQTQLKKNKYSEKSISKALRVEADYLYNLQNAEIDSNIFTSAFFYNLGLKNFTPKNKSDYTLPLFCNILNKSIILQKILNDSKFYLSKIGENKIELYLEHEGVLPKKIFTLDVASNNVTHGTTLSQAEWQIYIAFMQVSGISDCLVDIDYNSARIIDNETEKFLAAILTEFMSDNYIKCDLKFYSTNIETKNAIYQALANKSIKIDNITYDEYSLEMLRVHFGLMLVDGKLLDLNKILYRTEHPYYNEQHTQNIKFLSDNLYNLDENQDNSSSPSIDTNIIKTEVPSFFRQIFEAIEDAYAKIGNNQNEEKGIFLEDADFNSEDPELDAQIKKCFDIRYKKIKNELEELHKIFAQMENKDISIDESAESIHEQLLSKHDLNYANQRVSELKKEYESLLTDFQDFRVAYENSDDTERESKIINLASNYYNNRNRMLSQDSNAKTDIRRNLIFTDTATNNSENENDAIHDLLEFINRHTINNP